MKIEIIWHPAEDLQMAAQKGMSHNTTVLIENHKYTFSFIEFGTLESILNSYNSRKIPFALSCFLQNGLAIPEISIGCIIEALEFIVEQQRLQEFPYLID